MRSRMRPAGGQPVRQAGCVHLASLSTLARPGAEFRRRQALAFLEAEKNSRTLLVRGV